jgi:AraC-like DNA-binding protein
LYLEHIKSSLQSNIDLIRSRYNASGWQSYQARQELQKYNSANQMISAICYTSKATGQIVSTDYVISYQDGVFRIIGTSDGSVFLEFDPEPYYNLSSGQMIFLSNDRMRHLIYFPAQSARLDYVVFFVIDTNEITKYLKKTISDTIPAMVLIDSDKHVVTGVNTELLSPYLESLSVEDGVFRLDSDSSICIHTGISGGLSVISLISSASLNRQLDDAFASSYLLLFLLSCAGFALVLLAMKTTYLPLHRLTKKLVRGSTFRQEYLAQLDDAFTNAVEQNHLLEQKLKNYQISVKKSLLDSVIESNYSDIHTALPNLDQLFDLESPKEIFTIQMKSPKRPFPYLQIQEAFQKALPGKDSCIILKIDGDSALFLIHFASAEPDIKEALWQLLQDFHQKLGCFSAISNGSKTPLDIPALCKNAMHASGSWQEVPVADYQSLSAPDISFSYPHSQLERLAKILQGMDFKEARSILKDIHWIIHDSIQEENPLSDFFVRSILVDLITLIISYMIQTKIAYEAYGELYQETLYFCRSCPYAEKAEAIEANIHELLDICQQKASTYITSDQIRQLIEESYCQPDFSIYELADKLQISFTYTSNLIKRKLNQNFSDYVWTLRLEKAKELLSQTALSIDEVSTAVGYINTSSFRRKFKQETGLTPSEFRLKESE